MCWSKLLQSEIQRGSFRSLTNGHHGQSECNVNFSTAIGPYYRPLPLQSRLKEELFRRNLRLQLL